MIFGIRYLKGVVKKYKMAFQVKMAMWTVIKEGKVRWRDSKRTCRYDGCLYRIIVNSCKGYQSIYKLSSCVDIYGIKNDTTLSLKNTSIRQLTVK